MENEKINKKILKIWRKYSKENHPGTKRWPLLTPKLKENGILFIGINPSFRDNNKNGKGYWADNGISNPEDYFRFPDGDVSKPNNIDLEIQREKNAKNPEKGNKAYYPNFFNPIVNMMSRVNKEFEGLDWDHLDLFFIRETSHKKLKKYIDYRQKGKNISVNDSFAKKQLDISLKLIELSKPEVIVVQNAMASRIIQQELKIGDMKFNENHGFHIMELGGSGVPIFFSSIFSGGRLDNGSFKRLEWHIKKAIKWYERNNK